MHNQRSPESAVELLNLVAADPRSYRVELQESPAAVLLKIPEVEPALELLAVPGTALQLVDPAHSVTGQPSASRTLFDPLRCRVQQPSSMNVHVSMRMDGLGLAGAVGMCITAI